MGEVPHVLLVDRDKLAAEVHQLGLEQDRVKPRDPNCQPSLARAANWASDASSNSKGATITGTGIQVRPRICRARKTAGFSAKRRIGPVWRKRAGSG